MAIITAVLNQKGGVGKTTTTQNLGAAMAILKKKKTLLIDFDPQGNLTQSFGVDYEFTITEALLQICKKPELHQISENLYLIPATDSLSRLESLLNSEDYSNVKFEAGGEHYVLKILLDEIGADYDYVFLDCPPSLNILSVNALSAADKVLVPMEAQKYSVKGLEIVMNMMSKIKKKINPKLELSGLFFTRHNPNIILKADVSKQIQEVVGERLFHTFIRSNVAVEEASQMNMDIFSYDKFLSENGKRKIQSNGSKDYADLLEEFIGNKINLEARHTKNELTEEEKKEAAENEKKDLETLDIEFKKLRK